MRYASQACSVTETPDAYVFTGPCMKCKQEISVVVNTDCMRKYQEGALIQEALTNNADEREFLISGICPTCFEALFNPDDEDDTDEIIEDDDDDFSDDDFEDLDEDENDL